MLWHPCNSMLCALARLRSVSTSRRLLTTRRRHCSQGISSHTCFKQQKLLSRNAVDVIRSREVKIRVSLHRRISREVAVKYAQVVAAPLSDSLRRSLGKPWAAHIASKAALFEALTRQHQADVFIADDECGQQIACLQVRVHSSFSAHCPASEGLGIEA